LERRGRRPYCQLREEKRLTASEACRENAVTTGSQGYNSKPKLDTGEKELWHHHFAGGLNLVASQLIKFNFVPHRGSTRHYNIGKDIEKPYVRLMRVRWKELFTSKVDTALRWDRWDLVALAIALFIFVWVFALKLKTFYDLGYSSDLFMQVQDARSWLEGRGLLQDNFSGNVLATHTHFLLVPLGLIAKPFGAPGLLFVLAAFVGATSSGQRVCCAS
jgi:hypothetical protein